MNRYGHYKNEEEGFPVAAWVWGHRLRVGQHWLEYMLEFLNVMAGFDYALAEGVTHGTDSQPTKTKYKKFSRLSLRRFVFYDEKEARRHPLDDIARDEILKSLKSEAILQNSTEDPLVLVSSLLRSFACLEEKRAWFAKSLFPAHHNLLFFEAYRSDDPEKKIDLSRRNFFARGGEVYYLILSAGTQKNEKMQNNISSRLKSLLFDSNPTLGAIAEIIDNTQLVEEEETSNTEQDLGWIPDPNCTFYEIIASDVDSFLNTNLESLEKLDLLAYLINFHLTLYLYHRAHPNAKSIIHQEDNCADTCRLAILVDIMEGRDGGIIRQASATLYREQETRITQKAQNYVRECLKLWVQEIHDANQHVRSLEKLATDHFDFSKKKAENFSTKVHPFLQNLEEKTLTSEEYLVEFEQLLIEEMRSDFSKNFLGVHRKLSKNIGFASPKKGASARFTLSDNLLKVLTLTNFKSGMTYTDFLELLYERYGLVIGAQQAKTSKLYSRLGINLEYFDLNQEALLERMKRAGLAQEYSDATAILTQGFGEA